jgi:hypothetical protein
MFPIHHRLMKSLQQPKDHRQMNLQQLVLQLHRFRQHAVCV